MANPLKFPVPLGQLIGGATFATVAIPLTQNISAMTMPDGQSPTATAWNEIVFTADASNALPVYVTVLLSGQTAGTVANTTTYANVLATLNAGDSWPRSGNPPWSDKWFLGDYYLTFGNATDFCVGYAGRH